MQHRTVALNNRPVLTGSVTRALGKMTVLLSVVALGGFMVNEVNGQDTTTDQRLKDLQTQVSILQKQIELSALKQAEQTKLAQGLAEALKAQVTAESELAKAQAQGEFAKLAGIKAGLDSVGVPPGKEGKLTVTTGTAGALLLKLKGPMLTGLNQTAEEVAKKVSEKKSSTTGSAVVVASEADIQAALQASVTTEAIKQAVIALGQSTADAPMPGVSVAFFTEAAAAGLFLKTATDFAKFFRVDQALALFDAGEEANQAFRLLLERQLLDAKLDVVNLSEISPGVVIEKAKNLQGSLNLLSRLYDQAERQLTAIDKLPAEDPGRPPTAKIERLRFDAMSAKELLDGFHPARKPEAFWTYVVGEYKLGRISENGNFLDRLTSNAKAQTVQVIESRAYRSDKIYGTADVQVEYRLVDGNGKLLAAELMLQTFDSEGNATSKLTLPPTKVEATNAPR